MLYPSPFFSLNVNVEDSLTENGEEFYGAP
jgi:hypothetical protein